MTDLADDIVPTFRYEEDEEEGNKPTAIMVLGGFRRRPYIALVGGKTSLGKLFPVHDGMTIGRTLSCDLVLADEGVSRSHAVLSVDTNGVVRIADLGSSNGVLLAGSKVTTPTVMRDGDRFQIGNAAIALLHIDDVEGVPVENVITQDKETRLPTRRDFLEALKREHRFALRYKTPLSLLVIEIDNYKALADAHGPSVAVNALRRLGMTVSGVIAREDVMLARYAEEQVIVMLPETSLPDARRVAEWLRRGAEKMPLKIADVQLPLKVTTGIACTSEGANSADELVERAEQSVYRAKLDR